MQMLNDGGSIALLSSATNLYQLLTFAQTLEQISSKDQSICQDLENQRADLENQRTELENAKAEMEATQASLKEQTTQLNSKQDELAVNIAQANEDLDEASAQQEAAEAGRSRSPQKAGRSHRRPGLLSGSPEQEVWQRLHYLLTGLRPPAGHL